MALARLQGIDAGEGEDGSVNLFGFGKSKPGGGAVAESKSEERMTVPAGAKLDRVNSDGTARPGDGPATVRVHDEFGRELLVPIETWRTEMLPGALQKDFNNPDALYGLIVDALGLRLAADLVPAAAHLYATDPNAERGAVIYSIVLMDIGKPEIAERILSTYLASHAPSGVVLTNLAKALVDQHRDAEADDALWRGLQADPNQDNGLGWYAIREKERHGEGAWEDAMRRVAAVPHAWRAQVWLARSALERGDTTQALAFYAEALERACKPAPVVLLQQMSGDLGKKGLLAEAVALTRPAFDAAFHGLAVGNNLIKAELDLGNRAEARALVDELYLQQRKDWAENLNYWENAIKAQELSATPALAQPTISAYRFDGPVWLPETSPARALFAAVAPLAGRVVFLGSSISSAAGRQPGAQMPDAAGRTSRFMPLFLAESVYMALGMDVSTIILWVVGGGFAVLGAPWSEEDAAGQARANGAALAVVVHVTEGDEKSTISLRLLAVPQEVPDAPKCLLETAVEARWDDVGATATRLSEAVVKAVGDRLAITRRAAGMYALPVVADMGNYLLRLEQLLAVRCACGESGPSDFLTGEREMVRGQLDLALRAPLSVPVRLLLVETLRRLHALRPAIATEFREAAELLQTRYPLEDAAVQSLVTAALEAVWRSEQAG